MKVLESKVQRITNDYTSEIADLEEKIDEMKAENKNLRIPSSNHLSTDGIVDWKKKAETLEKQLEKKEDLLKKMT